MNYIYRSILNQLERTRPFLASSLMRKKLWVIGLIICSSVSWALPIGEQLVSGQVTVDKSVAGQMTINQLDQKAIINWDKFSIDASEVVNIQQSSINAALLNRVLGQDASVIRGQLNANGQVFLLNPNGVLFSESAQVDVGSLIASTHEISNLDFLEGNYHFTAGKVLGTIRNQGSIKVAKGGVVALMGSQVINEGTIHSFGGTTVLAAGETVDLDFEGDGLVGVKVSTAAFNAEVVNKGAILAEGGRVLLTAKAADTLVSTVLNSDGLIQARSLVERDGEIILDGGENGITEVSGQLDTSGQTSGGKITVTGENVSINQDGVLSTQALSRGTAGTINVLGDMDSGVANIAGKLDASAFEMAEGGFIETSAAEVNIANSAEITTLAANGHSGEWLIDPFDFTIGSSIGDDITGTNLSTALNSGNVTIQTTATSATCTAGVTCGAGDNSGNGDIFVNDIVVWGTNTLTLSAYRNININADLSGSKLALEYAQGGTGDYFINNGAKVNLPAGSNFSTKNNSNPVINYTVITDLGLEGSTTTADLQGMNGDFSLNYALGEDISAGATSSWNNEQGFLPIGVFSTSLSTASPFTGSFDGLGHTISNLTINRPSTNGVGLFGFTQGSSIRNIGLELGNVRGNRHVGGLVGYNANSFLGSAYVTGSVSGTGDFIGGLVGTNINGSRIRGSYATSNVNGLDFVGGLVGINSGSTISEAYATGDINGSEHIGGLVGRSENTSNISDTYATGQVSGSNFSGGLVGSDDGVASSINNSFWDSQTTGQTISAGGTNKTTLEMQQLNTFNSAGWDISDTGGDSTVWRIYEGNTPPLLRSFLTPLTVSSDDISKTYNGVSDSTLSNPVYSITPTPNANLLGTLTPYGIAKNVGSYTATGLYSNHQGYNIINNSGILTINPAVMTITTNDVIKTYDGTTTAIGFAVSASLFGTDSLSGGTFAFTDKNAGINKTVTVSDVTVNDGNDGNNYVVTYEDNLSSTMTPAALTITASDVIKNYDSTTTATGSAVGASLFGTDSLSGGTFAFTDKNAGINKTVTVSDVTVNDGNDGNNYVVTYEDNLSSTITPAALSITSNDVSRTYDGTTTAISSAVGSSLLGTDSLSGGTFAFTDKNAGTNKTVTVSDVTINDGNSGNNYIVTYTDNLSSTITPATLTVTASDVTKLYDGTTTTKSSVTASGLLGTDFLSDSVFAAFINKNVGTNKRLTVEGVTINDGNNGNNYVVTYADNLSSTITPATLTYTANNNHRSFGKDNPTFTGIVTGFVNGESLAEVTSGTAIFTSLANNNSGVGNYAIEGSGLFAHFNNYTFIQADSNATALNITPAVEIPEVNVSVVGKRSSKLRNQLASLQTTMAILPAIHNTTNNSKPGNPSILTISDNFADLPCSDDNDYCNKKTIQPVLVVKNSAGHVKSLQISANKQFLSLLLEDKSIRVWDFKFGKQRNIEPKNKQQTNISRVNAKGDLLYIASKTGIDAYDVLSSTTEATIKIPNVSQFVSSDDNSLLLVNAQNQLSLWNNQQNKKLWQLPYQRGIVSKLLLSNNNHYGAILSYQQGSYEVTADLQVKNITDAVDIVDLSTGEIIKSLPKQGKDIIYMKFKNNDTLQLALNNGKILEWSLSEDKQKTVINFAETITVVDIVKEIYSYILKDGTVRISDSQGNIQLSIQNKKNPFQNALLLEDGKKLLTVMTSGELSLWDVASSKKILRLFSTQQGWTVMDAYGRFDTSEAALENFTWLANEEDIPLDHFSENYYEPGLLTNILHNKDFLNKNPSAVRAGISLPPKTNLKLIAKQTQTEQIATLQADIYDRGGGINKIKFYHNGRLLSNENVVITQDDTEHQILTVTVSPTAGENTFKVVASNDMGIENNSTELTFDGKTQAYASSLRLLTVGINQHRDPKLNLKYSVTDATSIKNVIENNAQVAISKHLTNEKATKAKILSGLKELSQGSQNDILVIYLAGHGTFIDKEWYFSPYETDIEKITKTSISATELSNIFKNSKIQHILLVIDSCHSGGSIDTLSKLQNGQRHFTRKLSRLLGIAVMTSARKDQKAIAKRRLKQGVFTYLMVQELQHKEVENSSVTAHRTAARILKAFPTFSKKYLNANQRQEPVIYTHGNDFMLTEILKNRIP